MNNSDVSTVTRQLPQLAPGTCVLGANGEYVVEAHLGLGLTSQVYRARRESDDLLVALKVLRVDASQVSTENFWNEAWVLGELRHYAKVMAVPEVFDQQQEGDIRFLALEYVDHAIYQPLNKLLETDPLSEDQALEIARQALEVLNALHTKVERTYTDMQLKNFLWDAATQTLKIIDWNHVSTQKEYIQPDELQHFGVKTFEELAQRDLARFGAYLYQMLTGKGALERGEQRGRLARRAGARWEAISVAVWQVVVQALHPDPVRRYQNAAEFLQAVNDVQQLWEAEINQRAVRDAFRQAERAQPGQEQPRERLEQTWRELDMLERRGASVPAKYRERLYALLTPGDTGVWSSGKLYYDSAQYLTTIGKWEPEAHTQARSSLYRWLRLAQTGRARPGDFANVKADLEAVVNVLSEEPGQETYCGKSADFAAARRRWNAIATAHPWVENSPIGVLDKEIAAVEHILAGDEAKANQEWEQAVEAYQRAQVALENIAYANVLCEERGWQDLKQWIKEAQAYHNAASALTNATSALRTALGRDVQKGLIGLQWYFIFMPENEAWARFCLDYAREIVPPATSPDELITKLETALSVIDTALLWGQQSSALRTELLAERERLQQARHEAQEEQARQARRQRIAEEFKPLDDQIRDVVTTLDWAQLREASARLATDSLLQESKKYPELVDWLKKQYQTFLTDANFAAAGHLRDALRNLDSDGDAERARAWQMQDKAVKQERQEQESTIKGLRKEVKELTNQASQKENELTQVTIVTQKFLSFQQWAHEQAAAWQALEHVPTPDYAALIKQADAALEEARANYAEVTQEQAFQEWKEWVAARKTAWDEQQKKQATFQKDLAEQQQQKAYAIAQQVETSNNTLGAQQKQLSTFQKWGSILAVGIVLLLLGTIWSVFGLLCANQRLSTIAEAVAELQSVVTKTVTVTETVFVEKTVTVIETVFVTKTLVITTTPELLTDAALTWTQGITLHTMPSLILTVSPTWDVRLPTAFDTAPLTRLLVIDPEGIPSLMNVIIADEHNIPVPMTGTWTLSETFALWQPMTPTLLAGEYQVMLQANDLPTGISETLTVAPYYDIAITRVGAFDPGVPGMSAIYQITNTGNTTDTLWFSFVPQRPKPPLGMTITVTHTSSGEVTSGVLITTTVLTDTLHLSDYITEFVPMTATLEATEELLNTFWTIALPSLESQASLEMNIFVKGDGNTEPTCWFVWIPQSGQGELRVREEKFQ